LTSEGQTPLLTKTTKVDDNWNETITFSDLIFDSEDNSIANTLKNPLFSDIQVTNCRHIRISTYKSSDKFQITK
ncbi:MAG: hypothetical protein IIV67_02830, partial [Bacteroidaceae bacterium]|nr:hypothetical protein [Bacteroidaceae bacterium]